VGVKALGLDESLAVQTEAAVWAMFGRLLQDSLLRSGGAGNMKSFPSLRTPSTSKRRSLILRARA
jgi:hypothetical protein